MRSFTLFDETGKYYRKTYRWHEIDDGQVFAIRRNYHEISEGGFWEPETQKKAHDWCEANGVDDDLLLYAATPDGRTRFVKGVDDHLLRSRTSSNFVEMMTFHPTLNEEYDIGPLLVKTGVRQNPNDMHGGTFKKIAAKVRDKMTGEN